QAQALLEELKQSPERFAQMAKEKSADASTAQQGGELGWLTLNGGGLDATFIHAAFALQTPNELSNIVETAAGFHILQLQETRAETYRPQAEVREEIAETLRQQEAVRAYANADEQFSNLVYEHPDSLDPVAKQFGLKVQESDWLDRDAGAAPFDSAQLRAAVFDADAVKGGNNTEAIEIARGVKVAARVLQYEPARVPEFDEVKAQIEKQMRQDAAARMAREAGEALLAQLQKGEAADTKWPPAQTLERANEEADPLPQEAISAVFSANAQTLPTYVGAPLEGDGYGVFRIEKVERPEVTEDDPRLAALRRAYRSALAAQEVEAFLSALRTRYPVEIQPDVLQPTGAGAADEG
ncbi:MAG: peptidylprolyl isomerase, partial [Rhodocyclaceae bacterium]|nr:peptidylprolyl isomerase [Rhodocyclaceae bacterium]